MRRGPTGERRLIQGGAEPVYAFVPRPLPPEPPLDLTRALQDRLERATLAVGRLDSVSLLLPEPDLFVYSYVRREALLSSQIEGTQSSLSELLLFELDEAPGMPYSEAVAEVSRYVAALHHGIERLHQGLPLSGRLLREVHQRLLTGGRGSHQAPGEFRRSQNWLGGTRPGNAVFVPPPATEVGACLGALEAYLNAEEPSATLITAALAHVQFETIHPFLDGNGRVGRLLIALVLHAAGMLREPLLYLSLYFKQHRTEYYRLLNLVRQEGDWEAWLDFFLAGVAQTADGAVATARRLVDQFEQDRARAQNLGRAAPSAQQVLRALRDRPVLSLTQACERTGLSYPTVSRRMADLVDLHIATEITGQRRNRVFAYREYLAILSEGTEPL